MPSRTPGKYSLDSATLRMPAFVTKTAKRGALSDSSFFDASSRSRLSDVDGECVYSTPRASLDLGTFLAAKPAATPLTGNTCVSLGSISEAMEVDSPPLTEATPEQKAVKTPVGDRRKRDSMMQAVIEAALDIAEKKAASMASTNRPFSWLMQGLRMFLTFLIVFVRLVGSMLTGVLIAVAILGAVWILQPDNFLVVSVSREAKQLLRTYDLPGADFAWG
ncbi:hypothetical protein RvY_04881 [Ramazzottius varieornatus]|uniref:Uncharacterized protein n=1 Tax=Ramazzottius varieornatus TaxID=947166 RepID=A0A1D1UWP3_RAMVA|nr:hypothetical protein RvY_04881 [Ramazzottius varieornatus]